MTGTLFRVSAPRGSSSVGTYGLPHTLLMLITVCLANALTRAVLLWRR